MNIAIITGASSGIGQEFARQLNETHAVEEFWLIARRKERMEDLAKTLDIPCRIFPMDLTDEKALMDFEEVLEEEKPTVKYLVNSSGYGKVGAFEDVSLEDNQGMIRLNCEALVTLTYLVLPYVFRGGAVVQIASVASFLPQPYFSIYAASKAFVLSFSRALNQELKEKGIQVLAVCPNPVETEFFIRAGSEIDANSIKSIGVETKEQVVSTALRRLEAGKDISISCFPAKGIRFLSRILPHPFILRMEKHVLK